MNKSEKNKSVVIRLFGLLAMLFLAAFLSGCSFAHPGETAAEVHRRHVRAIRVNNSQLLADIDKFLLIDEPSRLNELRLP